MINHKKDFLKNLLQVEQKDTRFLDHSDEFQSWLKKKKQVNAKQKQQREERALLKKVKKERKKDEQRFKVDKKNKDVEDKPMVFEDDDEVMTSMLS